MSPVNSVPASSASILDNPPTSSRSETAPPQDIPGFPTYAEYKALENAHLAAISQPDRRAKSLISQALAARIYAVLAEPLPQDSTPTVEKSTATPAVKETRLFCSWARRVFTLGVPPAPSVGHVPVLLHKGRVVAVQENIYDILCLIHGQEGHKGCNRTMVAVEKQFGHIPQTLVRAFVRICPTCVHWGPHQGAQSSIYPRNGPRMVSLGNKESVYPTDVVHLEPGSKPLLCGDSSTPSSSNSFSTAVQRRRDAFPIYMLLNPSPCTPTSPSATLASSSSSASNASRLLALAKSSMGGTLKENLQVRPAERPAGVRLKPSSNPLLRSNNHSIPASISNSCPMPARRQNNVLSINMLLNPSPRPASSQHLTHAPSSSSSLALHDSTAANLPNASRSTSASMNLKSKSASSVLIQPASSGSSSSSNNTPPASSTDSLWEDFFALCYAGPHPSRQEDASYPLSRRNCNKYRGHPYKLGRDTEQATGFKVAGVYCDYGILLYDQ